MTSKLPPDVVALFELGEAIFGGIVEAAVRRALQTAKTSSNDEILTADEVGARTSTKGARWRAHARRGEIPAMRVGRGWRFRWADVEAFLSSGEAA